MKTREKIEWSNKWWENADDESIQRVLLIGDSITNGYASGVARRLSGIANVDYLVSSYALDRSLLQNEIINMLSEFNYEVIHFNNGLHGWHLSIYDYEKSYRDILDIIVPKAKIIIALSTPVIVLDTIDEIDNEKDFIINQRNDVARKLAGEYELEVNDLYSKILGKSECRLKDGYHYNDLGKEYLSNIVFDKIKNKLDC